jgi:hypothetical protein
MVPPSMTRAGQTSSAGAPHVPERKRQKTHHGKWEERVHFFYRGAAKSAFQLQPADGC